LSPSFEFLQQEAPFEQSPGEPGDESRKGEAVSELDRLFRRYQRTGERRALAAVYDRVAPDLLLIATHLLQDPVAAEDAVQATFLAVIENPGRFDASRPVRPWLVGILANQARLSRRAEGRRIDRLPPASPPDSQPTRIAEAEELVRVVKRSIERLPRAYRAVMRLRLMRGLEPHEIAAALRRSPGTVRSQLARGLERIRRMLPPSFAASAALLAASEARASAGRAVVAGGGAAAVGTAGSLLAGLWLGRAAGVALAALTLAVTLESLGAKSWSRPPALDVGRCVGSGPRPIAPAARAVPASPWAPPSARQQDEARASEPVPAGPPASPDPDAATPWRLTGITRACSYEMDERTPPLADCEIEVFAVHYPIRHAPLSAKLTSVRSDAAGRFSVDLEALKALNPVERSRMSIVLFAHKPGFALSSPESVFRDPPTDPDSAYRPDVKLDLEAGAVLSGRVVDPRGRVVREGHAGLVDRNDPTVFEESPILDGRYRLHVPESGTVRVRAAVPGLGVSRSLSVPVDAFRTYALPDLVLREGGVIEGMAVHADGTPARDLLLKADACDRVNETEWYDHARFVTGPGGHFRVAGLVPGSYRLTPVLDVPDVPPQIFDTGTRDARYRLNRPLIVIRVTGSDGAPLSGARVQMMGWPAAHADRAASAFYGGGDLHRLRHLASLYDDRTVDWPSGTQSLVVEAGSFWVFCLHMQGIETVRRAARVRSNGFETRVDLKLRPVRRPGLLRIDLEDPDRRPIPGFKVSLLPVASRAWIPGLKNRPMRIGQTLESIAPGRYDLHVKTWWKSCREREAIDPYRLLSQVTRVIEIRPGENRVALTASAGARLEVTFKIPSQPQGVRRKGCRVDVIGDQGERRMEGIRWSVVKPGRDWMLTDWIEPDRPLVLGYLFRPGAKRVRITFEGFHPVETVVPFEPGRLHQRTLVLVRR